MWIRINAAELQQGDVFYDKEGMRITVEKSRPGQAISEFVFAAEPGRPSSWVPQSGKQWVDRQMDEAAMTAEGSRIYRERDDAALMMNSHLWVRRPIQTVRTIEHDAKIGFLHADYAVPAFRVFLGMMNQDLEIAEHVDFPDLDALLEAGWRVD